jgi:magnesium-transporting ATPase (P-type)
MKPNTSQPKAPESKPGSKPEAKPDPKDDLKTMPLPEVEKKPESLPGGLTQAEAQKRFTQYGPNELTEEKTNRFLEFLSYALIWFLVSDRVKLLAHRVFDPIKTRTSTDLTPQISP